MEPSMKMRLPLLLSMALAVAGCVHVEHHKEVAAPAHGTWCERHPGECSGWCRDHPGQCTEAQPHWCETHPEDCDRWCTAHPESCSSSGS